jgi:hypothetical protein
VALTSADDASDDNDENTVTNSSNNTLNKKKKAVAAVVASGPVFAQLPSKTEVVTWVSLSYAQRSMYEGTFLSMFLSTFLSAFLRTFFARTNCNIVTQRWYYWRYCAARRCALMTLSALTLISNVFKHALQQQRSLLPVAHTLFTASCSAALY